MGATFLVDLGNKNVAATTAPAPMAMLRGVKAGMFEGSVVVVVDVGPISRNAISIKRDK